MAEKNPTEQLTADIAGAKQRLAAADQSGKVTSAENLHDIAWVQEATKLRERDTAVNPAIRAAMEVEVRLAEDNARSLTAREKQIRGIVAGKAVTEAHSQPETAAPAAKPHKTPKITRQADEAVQKMRASLQADISSREKSPDDNARNQEVITIEKELVAKEKLSVEDIREAFKKMGVSQQSKTDMAANHSLPPSEKSVAAGKSV